MPNGPILALARGRARDFLLQSRDAQDEPVVHLSTDALAGSVWSGDDTDPVATPTVTWTDHATGKFRVAFDNAMTTNLAPGRYRIQVTFTRSSRTGVLLDGWLDLTAAPGTTDLAQALVTYDQMRRYATWLDDLQAESDQVGFTEQRAAATAWLIGLLCDRWRPTSYTLGDRQSIGQWPLDQPSTWLRARLEATPSHLIVREKTTTILALKAISAVCARQIGREGAINYPRLADHYANEAGNLLKTYQAEIDTGSTYTGTVGLVIHCGVGSLR